MKNWVKITLGLIVIGVGIPVTVSLLGTVTSVITAPGRVITKTMRTDNIIYNYEWFHDTNGAYKAKLGQIATHKDLVTTAEDRDERSILRIELAAMKQSCRELVTKYNANSIKTNRSVFKGREAPEELHMNTCE